MNGTVPKSAPNRFRRVGLNPARIGAPPAPAHRFRIGIFDAAIVSDGPLLFSDAARIYPKLPRERVSALLEEAFQPSSGKLRAEQNILLVDIGGHLVLFDTGTGPDTGAGTEFGPYAGRLERNLGALGIRVDQIDALVFTHAHSDHCGGTMREDGTPVFPNARIYISETELDFWERCTEFRFQRAAAGVRRQLSPLRDRITFIRDGEEFLPGLHALATPGHTPGHTAFIVSSAEEELCVIGDVAFHAPLSFAEPATPIAFDYDRAQAASTRQHLLGRLADERMRIVGYHMPWPGIGYAVRDGAAFRYVPAPLLLGDDRP